MSGFDERMIGDFACLDPVYVDGVAIEAVVNLGTNFATPFFRWSPVVRDGRMTFEKTAALYVVRPNASLDPRDPLALLLQGQRAPADTTLSFRH
jgi:hypothetical protein